MARAPNRHRQFVHIFFIQAASTPTLYDVATRYPGDRPEAAEADYLEALQLAQRVVAWMETQL